MSIKLFYGYCWNDNERRGDFAEGNELEDFHVFDWSVAVANRRGIHRPASEPSTPFDPRAPISQRRQRWSEVNKALELWSSKLRAIERQEFGVECGWHGDHYEDDLFHLAATKSIVCNHSSALEFSADLLRIDPTWNSSLDRWLAEFNMDPPQADPRWLAVEVSS